MKRALLLGLALFAAALSPADSIIFLSPEAAGRVIAPENYDHGLWIQWPRSSSPAGSNRLCSLTTGLDWARDARDLAFRTVEGGYASDGATDLEAVGYFTARSAFLGKQAVVALRNPDGFVAAEPLLLALTEVGMVTPLAFNKTIPGGCLVAYSAASWDDASAVRKRAGGNSIVIEYPPGSETGLSAAWLFAHDKPEGVPVPASTKVPGLLPAREVLDVLRRPGATGWASADGPGFSSAREWTSRVEGDRPLWLVAEFVLCLPAAIGALCSIGLQKGGFAARSGLAVALLPMGAFAVAGILARYTGLLEWHLLPALTAIGLGLLYATFQLCFRLLMPRAHPLLALSILMTAVFALCDPRWSVFSGVFAPTPLPYSPLAVGCLATSLTAVVAFSLPGGLATRLLAAVVLLGVMAYGVLGHPWWTEHGPLLLFIPILAVLAGAGAMRAYWLPLVALVPFLYVPWTGRLAWIPGDLIHSLTDRGALNVAAHMEFLVSPGWLSTWIAFAAAYLLAGKFIRHQIRRSFLTQPAARSLLWAALGMAAMGLLQPYLLPAALTIFQCGLLVLLFDAAGSA